MKIALFLAKAPGYTETFFRSKITGLQQSGHEVILFCGDNSNSFDLCPVVVLPKKYQNPFRQVLRIIIEFTGLFANLKVLKRFIKFEREDGTHWIDTIKKIYVYAPILKSKFDWLHFGFGTLALGAENLAKSKKAKMAVSFRGFDIGVYPVKNPNCYQKLWKEVDKIHVISDDIRNSVYQKGYPTNAPMVKITPAIDIAQFTSLKSKEFNFPIKIVSIARLHWKKGLDYTLEALSILKREQIDFTYTIVGAGPEEEALKFAAYQLGLDEQVFFVGQLGSQEVKRELENSQLYLQYSVQEGFCNAVLEAQSMGLLCIVSDAEGLSENVLDGQTGWVIPKRKPKILANKIKSVVDLSISDKHRIVNQAVKRVNEKFSIERQQEAFGFFYREDH